MEQSCSTLTSIILTSMSSSQHHEKHCLGLSGVSTSHQDWWEDTDVITRQKLIKGIKAGDIWLNKVKYHGTQRIEETYVLKCTCHHEERVCYNTLILGNVPLKTSQKLSYYGMQELCELHSRTGVGETGEYLRSNR